MDWKFSIERNREPLIAIVAALYAIIGLAEGGTLEQLKRPLYRKVLALLRPAEAAVRRLIIAAARGIHVEPKSARAAPAGRSISGKGKGKGKVKGQGRRPFRLFDLPRRISGFIGRPGPRRRGPGPRIRAFTLGPSAGVYIDVETGLGLVPSFLRAPLGLAPAPAPPAPVADDSVSAVSLCRRLAAITEALKDLPRQARRYARWRAKPYEARRPKRDCALRTGPPPYLRRKSRHEIHEILSECHWLARTALPVPDSS